MLRKLASGTALAAVVAVALVGCTPPEPVETTSAPSPTPTASTSGDPEAQLLERGFQASSELLALVDRGFRDGALPGDDLRRIATEDLIEMIEDDLSQFQEQGLSVSGSSELDSPSLVSNEPTSDTDGLLVVATCWDTSGTTTTDAEGTVVSGGITRQPRLFEIRYTANDILVTRTGPPSEPMEIPGCG